MLLLDTHAFVWLVSDQRRLTRRGKALIRDGAAFLAISSITGLEIALAVKRDRLKLPLPPDDFVVRALHQHGIRELPVTATLGCRAAALPDIHNDPFDRIIIATAQSLGMTILTKDGTIPTYPGVSAAW